MNRTESKQYTKRVLTTVFICELLIPIAFGFYMIWMSNNIGVGVLAAVMLYVAGYFCNMNYLLLQIYLAYLYIVIWFQKTWNRFRKYLVTVLDRKLKKLEEIE